MNMSSKIEKTFTEESSQNGKNRDMKFSEKWIYAVGLTIVFGVEFVLRGFLLPENANDISIDLALIGEWVALSFLVFLWIPKVEKKDMASIGLGKFKRRYLGWGRSRLYSGACCFFNKRFCIAVCWTSLVTLTSAPDKRIRRCHSLWSLLDWGFLGRSVLPRIPH
jgi:hypothetical protein